MVNNDFVQLKKEPHKLVRIIIDDTKLLIPSPV